MKNPEKDPNRGLIRTGIRLPSKHREWLATQAKKQHRSKTAQILFLIEAEERRTAGAARDTVAA